MPLRRWLRPLSVVLCLAVADPSVTLADDATSPGNVAAARRHYDAAHDDYSRGAYREAIAELEAAHALDPNAKDLVFNLGVVHEKLADIDEALRWFHLYQTMDLDAAEQGRADAYIRRLEGAKNELEQKQAPPPGPPASSASAPPPSLAPVPPRIDLPPRGRVDGLTVTAVGIAFAGLAFGVAFAVKAEADKPPSDYVTGVNGTYPDLVNEQNTAHREAVLADVGFGVAGASIVTAAVLYFARRRPAVGSTSVGVAPMACGGTLSLQGSF